MLSDSPCDLYKTHESNPTYWPGFRLFITGDADAVAAAIDSSLFVVVTQDANQCAQTKNHL